MTLLLFFSGIFRVGLQLELCLGHYATKLGVNVHLTYLQLPRPTDVEGLLGLNGTVQCLAKFQISSDFIFQSY